MPTYKDQKTGKWYASFYYDDWTGERKKKLKRGFNTKREAETYIVSFLQEKNKSLDMTFESFIELYFRDLEPRIKRSTMQTKQCIIEEKILPYFRHKKMNEISVSDIIQWQNELLYYRDEVGKPYSKCYLKTIHNQMSAILNHAVRYYELNQNVAQKAGNMGKEETKEMLFWTKEEYLKFSEAMMYKDIPYHAFEMLYWCGIRLGELLALTEEDFDFKNETVRITKSLQHIDGEDIITDPKTKKSNRIIPMPHFLVEEMKEYISRVSYLKVDGRIFPINKNALHREMTRGSEIAGVKRIRIHDLRHSHVSLLIEMGFTVLAIADRVGHESIDITYRYAHLFPSRGRDIAEKLNYEKEVSFNVFKK